MRQECQYIVIITLYDQVEIIAATFNVNFHRLPRCQKNMLVNWRGRKKIRIHHNHIFHKICERCDSEKICIDYYNNDFDQRAFNLFGNAYQTPRD